MAAYRLVYGFGQLRANCRGPGTLRSLEYMGLSYRKIKRDPLREWDGCLPRVVVVACCTIPAARQSVAIRRADSPVPMTSRTGARKFMTSSAAANWNHFIRLRDTCSETDYERENRNKS